MSAASTISALAFFAKYQYYILAGSVLVLGYAHYAQYKAHRVSKFQKVLLWFSTVVNIGVIIYVLKIRAII